MQVERFAADLAALIPPRTGEGDHAQHGGGDSRHEGDRIGLAISGGPDSLALLLLAHSVRPCGIVAATVDHRLRPTARAEAELVAEICAARAIPHAILTARWAAPPSANLQARARDERYALLAAWAETEGLVAVATAHHADDQAETLLMRLARGAGIGGLGGARPSRPLTDRVALIRPLLGWRKAELAGIVAAAGLTPIDDPANRDPRHDRARVRQWLADNPALDPLRLAASAAWAREADGALDWTVATLLQARLSQTGQGVTLDPADLPVELQRRLLLAAFAVLGATPPAGPDLARALAALRVGNTVTLAGLKLVGGPIWHLSRAPPRAHRG